MIGLRRLGAHELLVPATRYYMGRMTIAACAHATALAAAWPALPAETRAIIRRDLEEAFVLDDAARAAGVEWKPLGHDCDREAWEEVRRAWLAADGCQPEDCASSGPSTVGESASPTVGVVERA